MAKTLAGGNRIFWVDPRLRDHHLVFDAGSGGAGDKCGSCGVSLDGHPAIVDGMKVCGMCARKER